ncbi:probable carboxylesterase 2 [Musa acuminata AAA Group]|uniref:probable carboxylesterase 2 n=1 Tax=Musa acuminata AAA Group TaxID=214697 RepID=UPI0031DDA298
MDTEDEIMFELLPLIRIYKSGRVERYQDNETVPASVDPATGVSSKDVVIAADTGVSARLYVPGLGTDAQRRIPVLVYYHGGAFCIGNPFMPMFHNYLNSLVARAHVVAVSVNYRLAPEHPIPAAYDDSWKALRWVASHANGGPGPDRWLADHADFDRLFLAGDSAGANIAHHMAMRAGAEGLERGVGVHGVVLIHPYFLGSEPVESAAINPEMTARLERFWELACPTAAAGVDDPMINPLADGAPSLAGMDRKRVLVCVGVEDVLRDRGRAYYHRLREKRCGEVELYETDGKGHTFHFFDPTCDEALAQDRAICCFLDRERMRESSIE